MNKISILIVEDEPKLLGRLAKYISIFCDNVLKATNGSEALEIYHSKKPDIILTDINMPKLTGIELIKVIRQNDNNTQLIILSAHTHVQDLLDIVPLDVTQYLVKPIKMEQLKVVILGAIDKLAKDKYIRLNNDYMWDISSNNLIYQDEIIALTSYETAFCQCLIEKLNNRVSYEELHNFIYDLEEYSQDALFTIAKRVRKKTTKEFIGSCYKFGYKITQNL